MTPKVTVLMTTYNGVAFLGEAIESVRGQTFEEFEFLIVDDASTDESVSLIQSYHDERIRISRPRIDVAERSEPADLFRLSCIRLFCAFAQGLGDDAVAGLFLTFGHALHQFFDVTTAFIEHCRADCVDFSDNRIIENRFTHDRKTLQG